MPVIRARSSAVSGAIEAVATTVVATADVEVAAAVVDGPVVDSAAVVVAVDAVVVVVDSIVVNVAEVDRAAGAWFGAHAVRPSTIEAITGRRRTGHNLRCPS